MNENIKQMPNRIHELHNTYSRYYPAAFFVLGFLFDVLTLDRIDSWITIVQQAVFLVIISRLLYFRTLELEGKLEISPRWQFIWKYQNEILHFLLGGLLSAFTLFYFISSSLSSSIFFMILMAALLVLNEFPSFQSSRLQIKNALYAVCVFSYFAYLIPIIIGFVGFVPLVAALILSGLIFWTTKNQLMKRGLDDDVTTKYILYPSSAVFIGIAILYFMKVLPPIPMAAQYIGIYHNIEKQDGEFRLIYERPFWKFWQNGAQSFLAQPGDRIYCFARIFSPAHFTDDVIFHWMTKVDGEWQTADRVNVKVIGGRDEGFRAYTSKSNFTEGEWRVKIESLDGREIGRISLDIEKRTEILPMTDREFRVDVH